jgi:hypothetical protein
MAYSQIYAGNGYVELNTIEPQNNQSALPAGSDVRVCRPGVIGIIANLTNSNAQSLQPSSAAGDASMKATAA